MADTALLESHNIKCHGGENWKAFPFKDLKTVSFNFPCPFSLPKRLLALGKQSYCAVGPLAYFHLGSEQDQFKNTLNRTNTASESNFQISKKSQFLR